VIWQNQDGKEHSYTGVFVQQGIQKETDWFKVAYDDGDEEWMSLQTLETDGTLGLHGNAERRVRWCLMEHAAVDNGLLSQASGRPVIFEPDADAAQLEAELAAAKTEIRDDSGRPSRAAKRKAQEQLAGPAKGQNFNRAARYFRRSPFSWPLGHREVTFRAQSNAEAHGSTGGR